MAQGSVLVSQTRREGLVVVAALSAVAVAVVVLRLIPGVNSTTAGFALLVLVLLAATLGPKWVAITVAVASTLAFNYFFFAPVGTFSIADAHNWVSLVAFLVAAIVGSNLFAAAQARARIAVERAQLIEEREAAALARQRGELASTLLASLSHDLKTPLTVISAAVENLRGELPFESRRAQADAAAAELSRLNYLFAGLLDMARIDAAAIEVQREWVTPADVVDAAVAHARHALNGRDVRVEADANAPVHVDARLAAVALSQLLENAARYSPADRPIVVEARSRPEGIAIAVTDHGPGLDPAEIDHLFERFYRGRQAPQAAPGTGMGLAIAKGLLDAIGGRVWGENVSGGGARFSMVVPGTIRADQAGA